jgi:hypothetical protein
MNLIKSLLFLSLILVLLSCDKDDNVIEKEFELSSELLEQTVWKGTHIKYEKSDGKWYPFFTVRITLTFTSDTEVKVRWKRENSEDASYYNAKYTAYKNMLEIDGVSDMLDHWFVTEQSDSELVLESIIGNDDYKHEMRLTKVY